MSASDLAREAELLYLQPSAVTDAQAQEFFQRFPLPELMTILGSQHLGADETALISKALSRLLATSLGLQLAIGGVTYLQAALQASDAALRKLGAEQLGAVLQAAAPGSPQQLEGAATSLVDALQDPDTGVAAAATSGLGAFAATAERFRLLLEGLGAASARVAALVASPDAVVRARMLDLLVGAAGRAPDSGALLRSSGVLQQLLREFEPSPDALPILASLHTLRELAEAASSSVALLLCETVLPRLLPLLGDASLRSGALPVAATMLALAGEAAVGLPGAQQLVRVLADILDEAGAYSQQDEEVALDAAGQMGLATATAQLVLEAPQVTARLLDRALGSTSPSGLMIPALHAAASLAGLARADAGDRPPAPSTIMSTQAEDQLRESTYSACSSSHPPRTPAEVLLSLLARPFAELRVAVYRFVAALAVRPWFARELLHSPDLLDRLLAAGSESGQQLCEWRHSAVVALHAGLGGRPGAAAQNGHANGHGAAAASSDAGSSEDGVEERVARAVKAGPFGVGLRPAIQVVHEVASLPS